VFSRCRVSLKTCNFHKEIQESAARSRLRVIMHLKPSAYLDVEKIRGKRKLGLPGCLLKGDALITRYILLAFRCIFLITEELGPYV
jgi:hypothetical protein